MCLLSFCTLVSFIQRILFQMFWGLFRHSVNDATNNLPIWRWCWEQTYRGHIKRDNLLINRKHQKTTMEFIKKYINETQSCAKQEVMRRKYKFLKNNIHGANTGKNTASVFHGIHSSRCWKHSCEILVHVSCKLVRSTHAVNCFHDPDHTSSITVNV